MTTKTAGKKFTAEMFAADKHRFDDRADARTIAFQIGRVNILAISGGKVYDSGHGIILPVSNGYKVTVDLAGGDTYTVRRIRIVKFDAWLYGEMTGVYCDEVGEVAYQASCFHNGPFGTIPQDEGDEG